MTNIIDTVNVDWDKNRDFFNLREKDKDRIIAACEAIQAYENLPPDEKGNPVKSDYEIVSVLCYKNNWKMNFDQWNNFINCVRVQITNFANQPDTQA